MEYRISINGCRVNRLIADYPFLQDTAQYGPESTGMYRSLVLGTRFDNKLLNGLPMSNDTNLQFIRERINQVRSAIMYSYSDDVIKLPNNIVSAVKVDEEGTTMVCLRQAVLYA